MTIYIKEDLPISFKYNLKLIRSLKTGRTTADLNKLFNGFFFIEMSRN